MGSLWLYVEGFGTGGNDTGASNEESLEESGIVQAFK
jgi:hypothetical protein